MPVDYCISKARCGGEIRKQPEDGGKEGLKRLTAVDACGIPLVTVTTAANRHDSPLLDETLDALGAFGEILEGARVHLDRAYDSAANGRKLVVRCLLGEISDKGKSAPVLAGLR